MQDEGGGKGVSGQVLAYSSALLWGGRCSRPGAAGAAGAANGQQAVALARPQLGGTRPPRGGRRD